MSATPHPVSERGSADRGLQGLDLGRLLPREGVVVAGGLGATEVAVGGGRRVDRSEQVELLDDRERTQVEDGVDRGLDLVDRDRLRAEGLDVEADRLGRKGGWSLARLNQLFPILKEKRRQNAGELSGGQRQQVAVGRALMTRPSVLMLDEPTAGVSPIVMGELFDRIIEVRDTGLAVLMVEQNARQALEIADRGYVLVGGVNWREGTGEELLADPEVRKSFLGG